MFLWLKVYQLSPIKLGFFKAKANFLNNRRFATIHFECQAVVSYHWKKDLSERQTMDCLEGWGGWCDCRGDFFPLSRHSVPCCACVPSGTTWQRLSANSSPQLHPVQIMSLMRDDWICAPFPPPSPYPHLFAPVLVTCCSSLLSFRTFHRVSPFDQERAS